MGQYPGIPERLAVPQGKIRLCVAGFPVNHHTARAECLARTIQKARPEVYESWFLFTIGESFRGERGDGQGGIVGEVKKLLSPEDLEKIRSHKSSPFVWVETTEGIKAIGGRDKFCEWVQTKPELMANEDIKTLATTGPAWPFVDTSPGSCQ